VVVSGTTNILAKFTSSTTIGNSQVFDNGTNVGIGTNNPNAQMSGTIGLSIVNSSNAALGLSNGTNNWLNYLSGTTYRIWNNTSTEVMVLHLNGNVGIGTSTVDSGYKLDVSGAIRSSDEIYLNNGKYLRLQRSSGGLYIQTLGIDSGTDNVRLLTTGDFNIVNGSLTSLMTVKNGGFVGIKQTSPQAPLHVSSESSADDVNVQRWDYSTSLAYQLILKQTVTSGVVRWNFSQINNSTTYNNVLVLDRGNVGIGTTSPSRKLTILEGTGTNSNAYMSFNNSAERWVIGNEGGLPGGTNDFFFFDGGYRMVIKQGGNVLIGTTTDGGQRLQIEHNGNSPLLISTSSTVLFTGYRSNSTFVGYIGNGDGIITGGGATNFGIRAENDIILASGGNNRRLTITSGGNVGIGTASAGVRLVNFGATLATGPTLGSGTIGSDAILSQNGLYGLYTGVSSAGHVWQQVQRNDGGTTTYPLVFQPSGGGVGIGTNSPQAPLHVIAANSSDNALIQEWSYTSDSTDAYSLMLKQTVTSGVVRYNFSMVNNSIAFDNVLVLDRGNVGIGTANPSNQMSGTVGLSIVNGSNAAIGLSNGSSVNWLNYLSGSTYRIWNNSVSEVMTLTLSGNVLIGITSDNGYKLRVRGSDANLIEATTSGTNVRINLGHSANGGFIGYANNGSGAASNTFYVTTGAGTIGSGIRMDNDGNFTAAGSITATSFFESSDKRMKTLLENTLDYAAIANVSAKYYEKNGKVELGYFAQDVETILPSAISKREDGYLDLSYRQVHTAKIANLEAYTSNLELEILNLKEQLNNLKNKNN
jgi:hypothetical protein